MRIVFVCVKLLIKLIIIATTNPYGSYTLMFKVYHSNDLEILAQLGLYITTHDPLVNDQGEIDFFKKEELVIQSEGMKTYLYQKWAECTGICTLIEASFLWSYIWKLGRSLLEDFPSINPFDMQTLTLNLVAVFEGEETKRCIAGDPDFAPIHNYLNLKVAPDTSAKASTSNQKDTQNTVSFLDHNATRKIIDDIKVDVKERIYSLSKALADLYDKYQIYRKDWIDEWDNGDYTSWLERINKHNKNKAQLKVSDFLWQGKLWCEYIRKNYAPIATQNHDRISSFSSYEEFDRRTILNKILKVLLDSKEGSLTSKLPKRIFIYGINSLPPVLLDIFIALGKHIDVHYMLSNPCEEYWADLTDNVTLSDIKLKTVSMFTAPESIADDFTKEAPSLTATPYSSVKEDDFFEGEFTSGNSLLLSYGKLGRDNLSLLFAKNNNEEQDDILAFVRPISEDDYKKIRYLDFGVKEEQIAALKEEIANTTGYPTLLKIIQQDIFSLQDFSDPLSFKRRLIRDDDFSVSFMGSSSKLREVQVLYDHIIELFIKDPTLKPRDIIIMTPNIAQYAPFIEGVFSSNNSLNTRLPYAICDRSLKDESPIMSAIITLLNIKNKVMTAPEVFELLKLEQIRNHFAISVDDLAIISSLIEDNAIFQGLNQEEVIEKVNLKLPNGGYPLTFSDGLSRLTFGSLMPNADEEFVSYNTHIDGDNLQVLGHLYAFIEKLKHLRKIVDIERNVAEWQIFMQEEIFEGFFSFAGIDMQVKNAIVKLLASIEESLSTLDKKPVLSLNLILRELKDLSTANTSYSRFLRDTLNFCTFVPMRSIPFKHIMLIGMNETDFPRTKESLSFDMMSRSFRRGDRSSRDDDRYMFLEALLAATESLYISYIGHTPTRGAELNPSILVSELINYIQDTTSLQSKQEFKRIFANSALNVYDNENFIGKHSSFQIQWLDRDLASTIPVDNNDNKPYYELEVKCADFAPKVEVAYNFADGFFAIGLIKPNADNIIQIELDTLIDFWKDPISYFIKKVLNIYPDKDEEIVEHEDFTLADFTKNKVINKILTMPKECIDLYLETLAQKGSLPLGMVGRSVTNDIKILFNDNLALFNELFQQLTPSSKNVSMVIDIPYKEHSKKITACDFNDLSYEDITDELDAYLANIYGLNKEHNHLTIRINGTVDKIYDDILLDINTVSSIKTRSLGNIIKLYLLKQNSTREQSYTCYMLGNKNMAPFILTDKATNITSNTQSESAQQKDNDFFALLVKLFLIGNGAPIPFNNDIFKSFTGDFKAEQNLMAKAQEGMLNQIEGDKGCNVNLNINTGPDTISSYAQGFKVLTTDDFLRKVYEDRQKIKGAFNDYKEMQKANAAMLFGSELRIIPKNTDVMEVSPEELKKIEQRVLEKDLLNLFVATFMVSLTNLYEQYGVDIAKDKINSEDKISDLNELAYLLARKFNIALTDTQEKE